MKRIKYSRGFTLIEVMVVVFLMALLSTVALIRLGAGQSTLIESEARQFAGKLELLMDESILSASSYQIVVDLEKHEYEYQKFTDQWVSLSEKPFEKHIMDENMALELSVIVQLDAQEENVISIDADGVSSQFDLQFGDRDNQGAFNTNVDYWEVKGGYTVSVNRIDVSQ